MTANSKPNDPSPNVFDERVQFSDKAAPFAGWQPSPSQIAAWCQVILSALTPDERLRRLRADWRPMVACADGRLVSVTAEHYEAHLNGTPLALCGRSPTVFARQFHR